MIEKKVLKKSDVVFLYSQPPEKAVVGVIDKIHYPVIIVLPIKRDKDKKCKSAIEIDVSKDIPLSVLSKDKIKTLFTKSERKRIKTVIEDINTIDIFS